MGSEQSTLAIFVMALMVAAALTAASVDVSADVSLSGMSPGAVWAAGRQMALDVAHMPLSERFADSREALAGLGSEARSLRDILVP